MITDVFANRYPGFDLTGVSHAFFVQLFNLYDDHHIGLKKALLEKFQSYPYSSYAEEHIRIISQSHDKLCSELGYKDLDKPTYTDPDWGYPNYRVFKNYVFDKDISPLEKLSFFEILFRDAEKHFLSEIEFLERKVPEYQSRSEQIESRSKAEGKKYHNDGEDNLKRALPHLETKKVALNLLRTEINQRLKQHDIPLIYHNGYFQKVAEPAIEQRIASPFWDLISAPKYKNVEIDMLEAIDRYDSGGRDPAFYAAKALESMLKIVCDEKGLTTSNEKGASDYVLHLNSKKNGTLVLNEEKEELLSMFRIRNAHGHGAGNEEMLNLTDAQTIRYINSAMVWVVNLSRR